MAEKPEEKARAQFTDYHAKYFAYELTRRCPPDSVEKLAASNRWIRPKTI